MTPKEKFNKDVWDVLKRIKEKLLYAKKGRPISLSWVLLPVYGEEILEKLEEKWKVIKIRENPWKPPASTKEIFYLNVMGSRFDKLYRRYEKRMGYNDKKEEEVKIEGVKKGEKTEFLDNEVLIKFENKKCSLPPFKNEHFFCRATYEYPINEPVDWSIIYEKMTGYYEQYYGKPQNKRENWRIVYDAMEALNKRVKEVLGIEKLFTWKEKTVQRTC
jgi:hypothetical protein